MGAQRDGTRTRHQNTSESSSTCLCKRRCVLSPAVSRASVSATAARGRCGERAGGRGFVCVIGASVPVLGPVPVPVPVPAPLLRGPPG